MSIHHCANLLLRGVKQLRHQDQTEFDQVLHSQLFVDFPGNTWFYFSEFLLIVTYPGLWTSYLTEAHITFLITLFFIKVKPNQTTSCRIEEKTQKKGFICQMKLENRIGKRTLVRNLAPVLQICRNNNLKESRPKFLLWPYFVALKDLLVVKTSLKV